MSTPGVPAPSDELVAAALARYAATPPPPLSLAQERVLRHVFEGLER